MDRASTLDGMQPSRWLLAGSLGLAAACQDVRPAVSASLDALALDGSVGIDAQRVRAKNSIETLGLDGSRATPGLRLDFAFEKRRRMHLVVQGLVSSHDGGGTLDEEFSKGPVVIPAGSKVDSAFDVGIYSAAWTFDFADRDDLEAGLGFGLAWVDLEASFESRATGDEILTDQSVPVPLIAGRCAWQGERLALSCDVAGIDIGYAGDHATFVDVDVAARWRIAGTRFSRTGELLLGWRTTYAGVDYDDDLEAVDGAVSRSGPYFGLGFRF